MSNISKQISEIVSGLSIREKLGQLLMLDFRYWGSDENDEPISFTEMNTDVSELIKKYNLGGICFFRENTETTEQIIKLTNNIQKSAVIPLFIAIDQEGGVVTRLQEGTDMPGNMALGAVDNPELTRQVANAIGTELKVLGINMNFAPDIDVNSNPLNPIIGVRAFSSSADIVSKHGIAYLKGLKEAGVISSVKHFPGHGNTENDTHHDLAVVNYSEEEVNSIDLKPFYEAVKFNVDNIMAAHVTVPVLDNSKLKSKKSGREIGTPTTLSKRILTRLLREKMKYNGVVVTDALDMKAISDNFSPAESTIMTILAGADMPVMPVRVWDKKDICKLEELILSLQKEYEENLEFKNRVEESLMRLLKLKRKFNLLDNSMKQSIAEQIESAKNIICCSKHKILEEYASAKAVTLLKNENSTLPILLKKGLKVLLIDSSVSRMNIFISEFESICKNLNIAAQIESYKANFNDDINTALFQKIKEPDVVIICTYNLKKTDILPGKICCHIRKCGKKSIVVACRNPYDILQVPDCSSFIAIYGASGFDQTNYKQASFEVNLKTAVRTIFTSDINSELFVSPNGELPVTISPDYEIATGLKYTKSV